MAPLRGKKMGETGSQPILTWIATNCHEYDHEISWSSFPVDLLAFTPHPVARTFAELFQLIALPENPTKDVPFLTEFRLKQLR